MQEIFEAAKVALSLALFIYASWSDFKTREVSNRVWLFYAPVALILSAAEFLLYEPSRLPFFGLSFGVTAVIAVALFHSGGFGGADSKALMCLALALPFIPTALFTPFLAAGVSPLLQNLFPLTVFSNAVLFAAASGIYLLIHNILWHTKTGMKTFDGALATESFGKRIVTLITGYKVPVATLKEKWHIYPMEDITEEDGGNLVRRKLVVVPREEGRDEIVARLSKAVDAGKIDAHVWATPGLPMLIFVTLGLIVALLFGDIIWLLVISIFG